MSDKQQKTSNLEETIIQIVMTKHPKTVIQLVELVIQENPLPKRKILKQILKLQTEGKLNLRKNTTLNPSKLWSYFSLSHTYWYWLIITLAVATAISVFLISEGAYPIVYVRYILGSIFVLFLPGYTFIKTLFPTKELDSVERIGLSIGMSLALVPITGLILNYTPWGIRTSSVTLSLLTMSIIFATIAIIREHQTFT